jgi:hypothetical protein
MRRWSSAIKHPIRATPRSSPKWELLNRNSDGFPLLAGELTSAFALTERDNAGADPSNLASTAARDGNGWILNGHKWFITNPQSLTS